MIARMTVKFPLQAIFLPYPGAVDFLAVEAA